MDFIIPARYCGPPRSGNGGWFSGHLISALHAEHGTSAFGTTSEVRLRAPSPLDKPLTVSPAGDGVEVHDLGIVIGEAKPVAPLELDLPDPVSLDDARRAAASYDPAGHPIPGCYVCGPERAEHDGLRIFASPVEGREGLFAAPVVLDEPSLEGVCAALDCPGAFAVGLNEDAMVLGTYTVRVERLPEPGAELVVTAWERARAGRKRLCATALYDGDELLASAAATWIVVKPDNFVQPAAV